MARLLFITGAIFLLMGSVCLTQAQTKPYRFHTSHPTHSPVTAPQVDQPQVQTGLTLPLPGGSPPQQVNQPQVPAAATVPGGNQQPQTQPVYRPASPPIGPAVPPVVTYRDGLLTVQALNSELRSVITAIRNKTGIEFEGMENTSERVAISLGPATEADVLTAIFTGSNYDFVALGRPDSPSIVQRVILTVKNRTGAPATEAQAQPRPVQQGEGDEEEVPDEQVNAEPQDTPVQPPQIPQQPPQAENQQPQQPKTPEQLLQELQQMQNQKAPPDPQNPSTAPRKMPPRSF